MSPEFHPLNPESNDHPGADAPDLPENWYSRDYLPHFDGTYIPQSITFRLSDSLPKRKLDEWEQELASIDEEKRNIERRKRIARYLDQGHGKTWLKNPAIAEIVQNALFFYDEEKYHLHSWVIMPNHVHVLTTIINDHALSEVLHGWKSFTAKKANQILERSGKFWQKGFHDRYIRDIKHFWQSFRYIEMNPVKAKLCMAPDDWRFSSTHYRKENGINVMNYDKTRDAGGDAGAPGKQ